MNEFIKNIFNQLEPFINMLNIFQKWDFLKECIGKTKKKSQNIYSDVLRNKI